MAAISTFRESTPPATEHVTDLGLNVTQLPSACTVLKFEGVAPWDNSANLVSAETTDFVHRLTTTVVLPLAFLIGGPANVINMAVFHRQGLKERINVCLFSLSLADFLYVFCNTVLNIEEICLQLASGFTTGFSYGPLLKFMFNHNLIGFYGFTWVSQIISAIIASERCFCILQPLRSQTVLSTTTTTIVIVIVNVVMVGLYSVVVTRYRAECVYDPLTAARTWALLPSQFYFDHQQLVDFLDGYVFGAAIPVLMMVVVMVTTIVTMVKLRQAATWRASASSISSLASREVALTVMLVYNSIFFVVCVFPLALFRVAWLFIDDLNAGKEQHNLFFLCTWLLGIMTYINATFNILVYYTVGSRYRQTFWQLMGRGSSKRRAVQEAAADSRKTASPLP